MNTNSVSLKLKKNQKEFGQENSIIGSRKSKSLLEKTMAIIFLVCAFFAVAAVGAITVYMIISGAPALKEVGIADILFGTEWAPTAENPQYGILFIVLTSVVGTSLAILIGVPMAVLAAVFLSEIANPKVSKLVKPAVELLAGIPSVIYGLLGIVILKPAIYRLEEMIFKDDPTHQMTGGANLLSAVLVLAIMILPTVVNVTESSLRAVPQNYRSSSLALGASKIQTIFKVVIPAAKSGIATAVVLGVGRAIGEAMAIVMVAGNSVNLPLPFNSVRFLTTAIVSEMSYSEGTHRKVLFTIGLVLFVFIMIINIILNSTLKKSGEDHD